VYPLYYMAKLRASTTRSWSVVIIFTVIQMAWTYFIASVMRAFPPQILDAAKVDGCSNMQLLVQGGHSGNETVADGVHGLRVHLDLERVLSSDGVLILQLAVHGARYRVAVTQGQHMMNESQVAASALLGVLPCVVFFLLFQRTLTRGITAGSYR